MSLIIDSKKDSIHSRTKKSQLLKIFDIFQLRTFVACSYTHKFFITSFEPINN